MKIEPIFTMLRNERDKFGLNLSDEEIKKISEEAMKRLTEEFTKAVLGYDSENKLD